MEKYLDINNLAVEELGEGHHDDDNDFVCVFGKNEEFSIHTPMIAVPGIEPFMIITKLSDDLENIVGVCRISVLEPKYITGYNENITLSDEEKILFIERLKTKYDYLDYTPWYSIVSNTDYIYEFNDIDKPYNGGLDMPDYRLL